jgi:hypothetical protein
MIATIQTSADRYQEPHDNILVVALIFALVVALIIWKLWPSIIANSVFSKNQKYNYGESKELINRKRSTERNGLLGAFMTGLGGLALLVYDNQIIKTEMFDTEDYAFVISLFLFSLLGTISALVYIYMKEDSFSDIQNIKYTLRVWLTTMLIAPLPLLLMDWQRAGHIKSFFYMYLNTLALGYGLSIISFAIVMYTVHTITFTPRPEDKKRLQILLITEAALLLNMFLIAIAMHSGIRWLLQVSPYCIVAGLAIWFYPINKPVYPDEILHTLDDNDLENEAP